MAESPRSIMLFAAGFGTRMGDLTRDRPKPLIRVAGKALIDHTLDLAGAVSPARIVANLHYKGEMLEAHLAGTEVITTTEAPDILDTGGGLKAARTLLDADTVYTANTDAIWQGPNPFKMLADAWRPDRMDALLLCVPPDHAIGHAGGGDFHVGGDGRLRRGPGVIFGGIQILKTDDLDDIDTPVFSLNTVWDRIARRDRLFGLTYPGRWCDVGTPRGIALAETLLEASDVSR